MNKNIAYDALGRILAVIDMAVGLTSAVMTQCMREPKEYWPGLRSAIVVAAVEKNPGLSAAFAAATEDLSLESLEDLPDYTSIEDQGLIYLAYMREYVDLRIGRKPA